MTTSINLTRVEAEILGVLSNHSIFWLNDVFERTRIEIYPDVYPESFPVEFDAAIKKFKESGWIILKSNVIQMAPNVFYTKNKDLK